MANPFSEAFANDEDEDERLPMMNHSPYQLGSVYGEDSASLLDHEYGASGYVSSTEKKQRRPPPPPPLQTGPEPPKTAAEKCLGLVPIYNEVKLFRRIEQDIIDSMARSTVKLTFMLHWLNVTAYCLNAVSVGLLFFSVESTFGSLWSFLWSLVYIVVGTFFGWWFIVKAVYKNFRSDVSPSWSWFNVSFLFYMIFTTYLIIGFKNSGSSGFLVLMGLMQIKPLPAAAVGIAVTFFSLEMLGLIFGLFLFRSIQTSSTGHAL